jgi:hypothetical protein
LRPGAKKPRKGRQKSLRIQSPGYS